jgi:hypothetical protein
MKIAEIYKTYRVPSVLQRHMLGSAALAQLIFEHWNGPLINKDIITTTMLIHDIGNIAKMDFRRGSELADEYGDTDYWRKIQGEFINKYGADDHIATFNVASELGLGKRVLWLVINKIFVHNEMISASNDYELKICAYSDQHIGPRGVVSLEERFSELRRRYGGRTNASINHPRIEYLIGSAFEIERQVLESTSLEPAQITGSAIAGMLGDLSKYEIGT